MARIRPLEHDEVSGAVRAEYDRQIGAHGRMTNMKRTLAHSEVALRALMEWYALREQALPFLGERLCDLYSHAISADTDCLICSTYFRRALIDRGENPDTTRLDEREQTVIEFGRRLVADRNRVPDELYERLARFFTPAQIVTLTAFGALMIATNVFNNALDVDLDGYLEPYTREAATDTSKPRATENS